MPGQLRSDVLRIEPKGGVALGAAVGIFYQQHELDVFAIQGAEVNIDPFQGIPILVIPGTQQLVRAACHAVI